MKRFDARAHLEFEAEQALEEVERIKDRLRKKKSLFLWRIKIVRI